MTTYINPNYPEYVNDTLSGHNLTAVLNATYSDSTPVYAINAGTRIRDVKYDSGKNQWTFRFFNLMSWVPVRSFEDPTSTLLGGSFNNNTAPCDC